MTRQEVYKLISEHYRENFQRKVDALSARNASKANAEDILQEAYTRAFQYWNSYDPTKPFDAWINSIVLNAMRDFFKTEVQYGMVREEDEWIYDYKMPEAFRRIEIKELVRLIDDEEENIAKILRLYLIEGYTSQEIDAVVPETRVNIRKIVQRFRDKLNG